MVVERLSEEAACRHVAAEGRQRGLLWGITSADLGRACMPMGCVTTRSIFTISLMEYLPISAPRPTS